MSLLLCCCPCLSPTENTDGERQPLLQPSTPGPGPGPGLEKPESARLRRADTLPQIRNGRLAVRRVCVSELDQRFSDTAETFNEQQERFELMTQRIIKLRQTYGCNHDDALSLTECVRRIREEHEDRFRVTIEMDGYDFSLSVVPLMSEDKSLPSRLRLAQEELKGMSQDAKATVAVGTKLQELIGWLLRGEEQMAEQVREATPTYQERCRLEKNLNETMQEVRRAKELSLGYRQQARKVLTEVAEIAGVRT